MAERSGEFLTYHLIRRFLPNLALRFLTYHINLGHPKIFIKYFRYYIVLLLNTDLNAEFNTKSNAKSNNKFNTEC